MPKATTKPKAIKMDATGRTVGRLASDIAKVLQGKHRVDYAPNKPGQDTVEVRNATKLRFTGRKLEQKAYYHYSGYPGGMKTRKLRDVVAINPADALRRAVRNMLPKNRLQTPRLKRLSIHND